MHEKQLIYDFYYNLSLMSLVKAWHIDNRNYDLQEGNWIVVYTCGLSATLLGMGYISDWITPESSSRGSVLLAVTLICRPEHFLPGPYIGTRS